ncbi:MAG: DUF1178 family protein [Azospirillum sp.]|nr:DUF1178 family protein [Azospirillum sp.]
MIRYALRCDHGHEFEEWFANMADYDDRKSELTCPDCGSGTVEKAIMAPNVGKARAAAPPPPCGAPACSRGGCAMAGFD